MAGIIASTLKNSRFIEAKISNVIKNKTIPVKKKTQLL